MAQRKFMKLKTGSKKSKPIREVIQLDSISLKVPVTIKAILTEELRDRLLSNIEKSINRMELELKQLDVDEKRNLDEQGKTPQAAASIQRFFAQEKQKRLNCRHRRIIAARRFIVSQSVQKSLKELSSVKSNCMLATTCAKS